MPSLPEVDGTRRAPRVWVVSDMYYPEDVSTGYFLTRIAEGLARYASVIVLCGQPSYAQHGTRAPRRERRNGADVRRLVSTNFPKDRLPLRALNVLTFTLAVVLHGAIHLRPGDRVLCVTNPPSVPPLLAMVARLRGARFVLLVHDVFPETLAAVGALRRTSLAFGLLARFANIAYRRAATVVVLGRDMARIAAAKRGSPDGVKVIENWADLDDIHPAAPENNPILAELGLAGQRVVQFSGNIGRTHGIETLLEAARLLRDEGDWHLLIAGFGGKQALVAAEADAPNLTLIARQPRARLSDLLSACDAHIIGFVPGMAGLSVPSRMYNVMAAGRPIVAMAEPEHELACVIAEDGSGWRVDPGDAAALARLVATELTPGELARRGANARAAAQSKYRFDQKLNEFVRLLLD